MQKSVRLPKSVIPLAYHLKLKPDLENLTFSGTESIEVNILKKTKKITLHAKELDIETAEFVLKNPPKQRKKSRTPASANTTKANFAKIVYEKDKETVTFYFSKTFFGKGKLVLFFKGILNENMRGLYKSHYFLNDQKHYLATTQFEATDARMAFPCFDEPNQKAIFHVSLIVPNSKSAISNTLPISVLEHEQGYKIINFAPTPKMSTYLLTFIVGDFEYIEKKSKKGVMIRVHTTPGKIHQAKFALEVTEKFLDFYEKYFDIPYPLNTLDIIAVPDFDAGAMENWGAVTFRESAILVDEVNSATANRQWVALVIAHELAHQWFGNLVTMEWWTHLWLNEGFASYIEYLAVDKIFPDWEVWEQFLINDHDVALVLDGLKNTHPIEIPVHHPNEISEIFDAISYSKGAAIIKMLAEYLGEKDFRDGLRYYLKKHSYKNTETIHLWQAFEKISKKPIEKIMRNWTNLSGYPIVSASEQNNKLFLSQERFFSSALSKNKNIEKIIWPIPVIFGNNKTQSKILFKTKNQGVSLNFKNYAWLKININESGFFRTKYSKTLLEKLKSPISEKLLSSIDRLGIIRDLFSLAEAGNISVVEVLEFLSAYQKEDSYIVLAEIAAGLSRLKNIFYQDIKQDKIEKYILIFFSDLATGLTWDKKKEEGHTTTLLRSIVLSLVGRNGHKKIITEARVKFSKIKAGEYISPDIRSVVYNIVAHNGSKKDFEVMLKMYQKENLHEEKSRLGRAMGYFQNKDILREVCSFALSNDVRSQDTVSILSNVCTNPLGREIWFSAVKNNWDLLMRRYGGGGHTISQLIMAMGVNTNQKIFINLKKFFQKHEVPGAKRSLEQVFEKIENNILWRKRDSKKLKSFLENYSL